MRLRVAAALAAAVVASVLAVPATAVAWVEEQVYVPTPHGDIYVDYVRPATGRAPVVLALKPSHGHSADPTPPRPTRSDFYRARYEPQGYAVAYADVLGTGLSDGCWTYGGRPEAESAAAVVEWLGTRRWSNGRVAMVGGGYPSAMQVAVATLAPRHLVAIAPQGTTASWYHDRYDHGVHYNSNDRMSPYDVEYPTGMPDQWDLMTAGPSPDLGRVGPGEAERVVRDTAGCEAVEHERHGYATPEYDAFWAERDWALRAGRIKAAILLQHGWRDTSMKPDQFTRFWQRLPAGLDARALLGQWQYIDVYDPGWSLDQVVFPLDPKQYLDLFLARHLKGVRDPRLERIPRVLTQGSDGAFRSVLPLGVRPTTRALGAPIAAGTGTFVNTGTETSQTIKDDPASQRGFAAYAIPFGRDARLVGSAQAVLRLTTTAPRGQLAVTLLDLAPGATAGRVVALGMLDLRLRDSLAAPKDVPVATPFTATVTLRPQDYVIKKGHRLVVAVAGSEVVWGIPDPVVGQVVTVLPGSTVRLPMTGAGAVVA